MSKYLYADQKLVNALSGTKIDSRSNNLGGLSCQYFLEDLRHDSPFIDVQITNGRLNYFYDKNIGTNPFFTWNIDLVLGVTNDSNEFTDVWLAMDAKSIMTEHGKARRNRQRDLLALSATVRYYYPNCVVTGLLPINMSDIYHSSLKDEPTIHKKIDKITADTIEIFEAIPKYDEENMHRIDGVGLIIIKHTNDPNDPTFLITDPPAPDRNHLSNYHIFLRTIKHKLEERFR